MAKIWQNKEYNMIYIQGMIEKLEIRLAQKFNHSLETEVEHVMNDVARKTPGINLKLYKKNNLNSDYLIIIFHSDKINTTKGSDIGQGIKSALNNYGLVNHGLWIDMNPKQN